MELNNAMNTAASGLKAQSLRLRVISENIANAQSLATTPGGMPYQRKVISFDNEVDRATGAELVTINKISRDRSDFQKKFDPNHPAADKNGYVLMPNVNRFLEQADMREAQRSYEANLQSLDISRTLMRETVGILQK